ncbi:MAG: hypothetical protein ABIE22_03085 [archaeon]
MRKGTIIIIIALILVMILAIILLVVNLNVLLNVRQYLGGSNINLESIQNLKIPSSHGYWCEGFECLFFCQQEKQEINRQVCKSWCANDSASCQSLQNQAKELNITLNLEI